MNGGKLNASELIDSTEKLKIALVGDYGVGKTTALSKIASEMEATVKLDDLVTMKFKDKEVEIWDSGLQRYSALENWYFRDANGAAIVYDITNLTSFERVPTWKEKVIAGSGPNTPIMLIGNKTDLSAERQVPTDLAAEFAHNHGLSFFEISVHSGSGVKTAFSMLLEESLQAHGMGNFRRDSLKIKVGAVNLKFCHF